jgi:hypothetical protein
LCVLYIIIYIIILVNDYGMVLSNLICSFQTKIAQNRFWPIEIMRTPLPQATKSKGKQTASEEEVVISYHGVAYVNMAPLLYPGVNR